ncbi:hypothetical protein PDESU_02449 [Pontiella desulfatans]|uniref:Uncharacterized protein n=1 Tax=Pontiella desulfatans TaxID=2750659 RepID=A0A6C2U1R0_PONDE|nr:hypothetical protein [Pontiella desulfatans]VGO13892.1 hypothetical protein PDESU_02449 [Pontiella desulfatans]
MAFEDKYGIPLYDAEAERQKDAYNYHVETGQPAFEIIQEIKPDKSPFKNPDELTERIFNSKNAYEIEPLDFTSDRLHLHGDHIDVLVKQLRARHAISYGILKNVEYEQLRVHGILSELRNWPNYNGIHSRFESELEKQVHSLAKEKHAEEVACWRDTNRLLGDIFDSWSGYADERRKKRVLNDDL